MGWLLAILDWSLCLAHLAVVFANLGLWAFPRTRRIHRWIALGTAASWLGLGIFYGFGYCFLTDWHWAVKRARGVDDLPYSFIQYALVDVLGLPLAPRIVDGLTLAGFLFSLCMALLFWRKERARLATAHAPHHTE